MDRKRVHAEQHLSYSLSDCLCMQVRLFVSKRFFCFIIGNAVYASFSFVLKVLNYLLVSQKIYCTSRFSRTVLVILHFYALSGGLRVCLLISGLYYEVEQSLQQLKNRECRPSLPNMGIMTKLRFLDSAGSLGERGSISSLI